jgi:hypothetical protein
MHTVTYVSMPTKSCRGFLCNFTRSAPLKFSLIGVQWFWSFVQERAEWTDGFFVPPREWALGLQFQPEPHVPLKLSRRTRLYHGTFNVHIPSHDQTYTYLRRACLFFLFCPRWPGLCHRKCQKDNT